MSHLGTREMELTMGAKPKELTPDRSARDMFGSVMRRHRLKTEMSLERLAAVLNYSKSALARYETAESMIPEDLPPKLDGLFDTGAIFADLYLLARKEVHPDQFRRVMEAETRALLIQQYTGQLVPGLVQTSAYARALFECHNPRATPEAIDDLVVARMGRQALLTADPPPDLSLILDESVLKRAYGGPAAMREQLQRLMDLTHAATSVLQIIPFDQGGHALAGGSLKLLTLDDGAQLAYEEAISTGTLIEDSTEVMIRQRAYDLLKAYALSPSDSATFIKSAMEALPT